MVKLTKEATQKMSEEIIEIEKKLNVQSSAIIELRRLFKANLFLQKDSFETYNALLKSGITNREFEARFEGMRACLNYLGKCLGIDLTTVDNKKLFSIEFINSTLAPIYRDTDNN